MRFLLTKVRYRLRAIERALLVLGFLFCVTALGYGVCTRLRPRLVVDPPHVLVDPRNVDKAPFILKNEGYLSVYEVEVHCTPTALVLKSTGPNAAFPDICDVATSSVLRTYQLMAGHMTPFVCDILKESKGRDQSVYGVHVRVLVAFNVSTFLPLRLAREFNFRASIADKTNTYHYAEETFR
jgi:hypothetical protein